jgi:hypothetical protein
VCRCWRHHTIGLALPQQDSFEGQLVGFETPGAAKYDSILRWSICALSIALRRGTRKGTSGCRIGIVWTNTDALISGWARSGQLGATMGAAGSFKEFGDMLGLFQIGLLAQALSLSFAFAICGALALASLVLVIRSHPRPARRELIDPGDRRS